MAKTNLDPVSKWDKEEKERKFKEKDAKAKREAEDLVKVLKEENEGNHLIERMDRCNWNNPKQVLKFFDEIERLYLWEQKWGAEIPSVIYNSFYSLLKRTKSIDRKLMKKILKYYNLWKFDVEFSPSDFFDKCEMDDELIYNSIMAGWYTFLKRLVDDDRLKEINKKAYDDFKRYLFSGELENKKDLVWGWWDCYLDKGRMAVEDSLFEMLDNWDFDYEVFDFLMKHDVSFKEEFQRYAEHFTGMSDEEFKTAFGHTRNE